MPNYTEQDIQLAEMYLADMGILDVEDMFRECSPEWYEIVFMACWRLYHKTLDRKYYAHIFRGKIK